VKTKKQKISLQNSFVVKKSLVKKSVYPGHCNYLTGRNGWKERKRGGKFEGGKKLKNTRDKYEPRQ